MSILNSINTWQGKTNPNLNPLLRSTSLGRRPVSRRRAFLAQRQSRANPEPYFVYDIDTHTVVASIELGGRETNQAWDKKTRASEERSRPLPASGRQWRQLTTRGFTRHVDPPRLTRRDMRGIHDTCSGLGSEKRGGCR